MYKNKKVTAIITAGGRGTRMGAEVPKQFLSLGGKTILERTLEPFISLDVVDEIIVTLPEDEITKAKEFLPESINLVSGGKERQDSIASALSFVNPEGGDIVVIHDGVRPYVDEEMIMAAIDGAYEVGASTCAIPSSDTIRHSELGTLDRSKLYRIQTPQAFQGCVILDSYKRAKEEGFYGTDDAGLAERYGYEVKIVPGKESNIKITTKEDLPVKTKIGTGFDVHRLVERRKLILCGEEISFEKGLDGHSDADVAVHALMDALLGAASLPDIGRLFPDTDDSYKGISSMILLEKVSEKLKEEGYQVSNVDITIICQAPKLAPYMDAMKANISKALDLDPEDVGLKATTTEKLGFTGRGEGIAAEAVCLLTK